MITQRRVLPRYVVCAYTILHAPTRVEPTSTAERRVVEATDGHDSTVRVDTDCGSKMEVIPALTVPEVGQEVVDDALVTPVILVDEQLGPVFGQSLSVDSKAVVLGGDEAAASACVRTRLVVSAVTIPIEQMTVSSLMENWLRVVMEAGHRLTLVCRSCSRQL